VPQVSQKRPLEEAAGVVGVVSDARHDVAPPEALRILEGGGRKELSRLEVQEPQDHRGRAKVDGKAMKGPRSFRYGLAVKEDALSDALNGRVDRKRGRIQRRLRLDPHLAPAKRAAAHRALRANDARSASEPESFAKVPFLGGPRRKLVLPLGDFHDALATLAVLVAGRRDSYPRSLGAIKDRRAWRRLEALRVDFKA
jgi:hypothetical protein